MTFPLTRAKLLQNRAFLCRLEETGNARLAAAQAGASCRTMQRRRDAHPAFAQEWKAALVMAQARLAGRQADGGSTAAGQTSAGTARRSRGAGRTRGGEAVVVRRGDGTMQVRRAHPGRLTAAAEQRFLSALSATCNVRLAAAAAGTQTTHFYRRRQDSPAFAREWRLALQQGHEAITMALIAGWREDSYRDDAWRHNAPPPVPPMTVNQAMQLLYLHQKAALDLDEPPHLKRRRGETDAAYDYRLSEMYKARQERAREAFRVAEAARRDSGHGAWLDMHAAEAGAGVDLAQVTGWSRADPAKVPHDATRALFGGWRIEDMKPAGGD